MNEKRFGRLILIEKIRNYNGKRWRYFWKCQCDCGNIKIIQADCITSGHASSCGCLKKELLSERSIIHGECKSNDKKTTEYISWTQMKTRCYNKKTKQYPDYGGRGISVCKRWLESFENFLEDMGRKPSQQHSLDRIDNDGNYEPGNCRWATKLEQNNNRRPRSLKILSYERN